MKISSSYIIASLAIVAIILWFLINALQEDITPDVKPKISAAQESFPTVVTELRQAKDYQSHLAIFATTSASRSVDVKAGTSGRVIATPSQKGRKVNRSALLCRQDVDARQALLDQALATLNAREFDYNSTKTLVEKGFQSAIQLEAQKAAVDGARASVKQAEIELSNVNIRAPFSGILDAQLAEVGDYLSPGQPCARIVQMHPLFVTLDLTEAQVGKITLGQKAEISLVTGETVSGSVHFIEATANDATRTFHTEISIPNTDYSLRGGVTAQVRIETGTEIAQQVPARILTLNDNGVLGVRYVDFENQVIFAPVKTIGEDPSGIWVTGLPDEARIIVEGQEYVSEGIQVNVVDSAKSVP